jgi:hypothetical protein
MSTALGTYQKVVIKGTGPGSEVWQTGFWTTCTTNPVDQPALQTLCNTIAPFVTTWWAAVKGTIYALYSFTEVDMYQYVAPSTTAQFQAQTILTASAGTYVTNGGSIDQSLVVSIRSARPGRSGRNRMYVPFHQAITATTGLASNSQTDGIGTATKALFTAVAGGSVAAPIVVSRTHGFWNAPSNIDTDNKPDIQRRRENRLLPTHTQVLAFP